MNTQIGPTQKVMCEFCGTTVRYDRLFRHIWKIHQRRTLTKPIVVVSSKQPVDGPVKHGIAVPIDNLKKCPHGVPEIQTCAICEPDKWRMENGY
jgi:hypothetical protein